MSDEAGRLTGLKQAADYLDAAAGNQRAAALGYANSGDNPEKVKLCEYAAQYTKDCADAIRAIAAAADELSPPWWTIGDYVKGECPNCGRERLLECVDLRGAERVICEKCDWEPARGNFRDV
jgi:hypothetical protein